MRPTLGFVIATYSQPEQTLFLCERLSDMFGEPPIAVHHDFSQCDLERAKFPSNVTFVSQWRKTSWGNISVVDAQLAALELLYEQADPHWFTLLSTTDYPIQIAERILHDLRSATVDAFIDLQRVEDRGGGFFDGGLGPLAFQHPQFLQNAYNRYVAVPWLPAPIAKRLHKPVETWALRSKVLTNRVTPFAGELTCYAGDHWLTATRRVASLFLTRTPLWETLHKHYRSRPVPEESFYHTLLGNTPGFHVSTDNLRFTDWTGCYAHPRLLDQADIPELLASSKHFARKLAWNPDLLAEIDRMVLAKAAGVLDMSSPPRHWWSGAESGTGTRIGKEAIPA